MNDEKQIAQAILDAHEMHEESYVPVIEEHTGTNLGFYKLEFEDCFVLTCKKNGLSSNLWALLSLANDWFNDIQLWAEDVLAGRDVSNELENISDEEEVGNND